jgi:transcriptional regulator with XRE-family HTH domain
MRADALPKVRTIPIRGDVLRTLRIHKGWTKPKQWETEYSPKAGMSVDRLAEIERDGARIFPKSLLRLAKVFDVVWQTLVDWEALQAELPPPLDQAFRPPMGNHRVSIRYSGEITDNESIDLNKIFNLVNKMSGEKGKIVAITVEDTGPVVTLELRNDAVVQFASAFYRDTTLADNIISAVIHLDVRVAGDVRGGGSGLTLRDRIVWGVSRFWRTLTSDKKDLPVNDNLYYLYYQKFEHKLLSTFAGVARSNLIPYSARYRSITLKGDYVKINLVSIPGTRYTDEELH